MRKLSVFLNFIFIMGLSPRPNNIFLVASIDEHYAANNLKTIFQKGRLWIVESNDRLDRQKFMPITGYEKTYLSEVQAKDTERDILDTVSKVSTSDLMKRIESLSQIKTREINSDENRELTLKLKVELQNLNLEVRLQCLSDKVCNVIARKNGLSSKMIVLTAHFDSVGEEFAGADDS